MAARLAGVEPHFLANAQALCRESGGRIWFVSAFRTYAEQVAAWNRYKAGGPVAAKPGSSKHEFGLAIDFGGDMGLLARLAGKYLMVRTVPSENWHYEPLWSRNRNETPRYAPGVGGISTDTPHIPGEEMRLIKDGSNGEWFLYIPGKGLKKIDGPYRDGIVWELGVGGIPSGTMKHEVLSLLAGKDYAGNTWDK